MDPLQKDMGNFKAFLFGLFTAYGIYYISRKGPDGRSVLDELIENPGDFMDRLKKYAEHDLVKIIKNVIK
jgi:hypothetical protein